MGEPAIVGGVYEVGIGVPDLDAALRYWMMFGYRAGPRGVLARADAARLYGVDSRLESIRLLHQDADHGLVRLMRWERPLGEGLGMVPLRTPGNRWAVTKTNEVMRIANFAAALAAQGAPVHMAGPIYHATPDLGGRVDPFASEVRCKREFVFFQPQYRHVLVQRYAHDLPLFGQFNEQSRFRASQFTQVGLCITEENADALDFYEEVFALTRHDVDYVAKSENAMPAIIIPLSTGELLRESDFDDVRSGDTPETQRSGKLRVFRITGETHGENLVDSSRAGCLGFSLYTYRVREVAKMREKIALSGASEVSPLTTDEFGATSFSFCTPDRYFWTFVGV